MVMLIFCFILVKGVSFVVIMMVVVFLVLMLFILIDSFMWDSIDCMDCRVRFELLLFVLDRLIIMLYLISGLDWILVIDVIFLSWLVCVMVVE